MLVCKNEVKYKQFNSLFKITNENKPIFYWSWHLSAKVSSNLILYSYLAEYASQYIVKLLLYDKLWHPCHHFFWWLSCSNGPIIESSNEQMSLFYIRVYNLSQKTFNFLSVLFHLNIDISEWPTTDTYSFIVDSWFVYPGALCQKWCWHIEPVTNFAYDIFKCIFLNEKVLLLIKISLKFVPKDQINNIPALV